jgi:hypothetical protein
MDNYDGFLDDGFNFEETSSFSPNRSDADTFKQRNDPQQLLWRFRLDLLNAYEVEEEVFDDKANSYKKVRKVKRKKGTHPKANSQGISDIMSYMEKFVNSHTVQGNIIDRGELDRKMKFISNDIVLHFVANRSDWGITIADVDILISTSTNLIDQFLSRSIGDGERKGYGESYKETTNKEIKRDDKPSTLQKMASYLGGR